MFDKWFREDVENILSKKDRIVILAESANYDFLKGLMSNDYKLFDVSNEIDELEVKYYIEKDYQNEKVVIFSTMEKDKLTFIREYCETCGCIDISKFEQYIKTMLFNKLELNIDLPNNEIIIAAKESVTKEREYWEQLVKNGSDMLFSIGNEVLPFLHNPQKFCKERDQDVYEQFSIKLNKWLERDYLKQPPETLAKEVANKILCSTLTEKADEKYTSIYDNWTDSKQYEESLRKYCHEDTAKYDVENIWDVNISHPFDHIDEKWLLNIAISINYSRKDKVIIEKIKSRSKDIIGSKWKNGLWLAIVDILEFDINSTTNISSLETAIEFYTTSFYKLDSAIRMVYSEYLNNENIIKPLQEYYENILIQFLDKWFANFADYKENQTGTLKNIIEENEKVAIIVGDGLSYEVVQNIIAKSADDIKVENSYKLAGIPSETENNMSLIYNDKGTIEPIHKMREKYLSEQFDKDISFIQLDEVSYKSIESDILVCSFKDIDSIAEKLQQKGLKFFEEIEDFITDKISLLLKNGFTKVVVTSDHGFVLTGLLTESDKIKVDFKGIISKSERYIRTESPQQINDNFIEIEQIHNNYNYLYFSKNNKPFSTVGQYGYAHGGLSPQELIIPFTTFSTDDSITEKLDVTINNKDELKNVVGENFIIKIKGAAGDGSLWTNERKVKILFNENCKKYNESNIITINPNVVDKQEYSFDGKHELDITLIDANSKAIIDRAKIIKSTDRDLGGLM